MIVVVIENMPPITAEMIVPLSLAAAVNTAPRVAAIWRGSSIRGMRNGGTTSMWCPR
jgi:hypothetical protein